MATYDIHKGIVSRNNDPEKRGRIRVKSQTLAGANVELPFWVEPCFPFTSAKSAGWFAVPDVGSVVELEVVISSPTDETFGESFIAHPDVHYRAGLYSAANPPPPELLVNYPRRRGMKTAAGHLLVFDDTKGKELLQLMSALGDFLQFDKDSKATLKAVSILLDAGQTIAIDKDHVTLAGV
jgi:hypothetical protein